MFKILFVDDEISVIEYLPLAIQWEELGISQLFAADNSLEALNIVRREKPDIALVDIEMPGKSGLEFCKMAKTVNPQIKLVILSAFDRFEYAKKAIEIGVIDYILKPVDENELLHLMRSIVSDLENTKKHSLENHSIQVQAVKRVLGEYLRNLFHHDKSVMKYPEIDSPVLDNCGIVMMIMQENQDTKDCGRFLAENLDTDALLISEEEGIYAVLWKKNVMVSMREKIGGITWKLQKEGFRVWDAYVKVRKGENVALAFRRCFYELETVSFMKDIIRETDTDPVFKKLEANPVDLKEGLKLFSEEMDISLLRDEIDRFANEAFAQYAEPVCICEMILDVFITLKMYITKNWHQDALDIFRGLDTAVLMRCGTPENLYRMIDRYLVELSQFAALQQSPHDNMYVVKKAKEYTKHHYQEETLSLQDVADAVGMSRTYFSKLFKDMTGEKYWDYLSRYRIDRAKELLCNTNLGQAEISNKVGYNSEFHFSRKFKEMVGTSPNKFRKNG